MLFEGRRAVLFFAAVVLFTVLALPWPAVAQPSLPEEVLKRLLLPIEAVLDREVSDDPIQLLLNEQILWVGPENEQLRVLRDVLRANDVVGAAQLNRVIQQRQTMPGVPADIYQSLPPRFYTATGSPAEAQAVAGTVVEIIVVIADPSPIPGELTTLLSFGDRLPSAVSRRSLEVPTRMARRLRQVNMEAPEAVEQPSPRGRRRLVWTVYDVPATPKKSAWTRAVGPAVRLSTLPSWENVADWFRDSSTEDTATDLGPELDAQVDIWTAGAVSRLEAIEILSDRLRLAVDLETAARPARHQRFTLAQDTAWRSGRTPAEVWRDRRGTGWEIARLWLAVLRRLEIPAGPAFVARWGDGMIETLSPDPAQFNYSLVTLDDGTGALRWLDPNAPHLDLDELPEHAAQRDALLVLANGYRFLQTPAPVVSALDLGFDLAMTDDGLDGTFRVEATGNNSILCWQNANEVSTFIATFFTGEIAVEGQERGPTCDVEGRITGGKARVWETGPDLEARRGSLPLGGEICPTAEPCALRVPASKRRIRVTYEPPAGWIVGELPPDLELRNATLNTVAHWKVDNGLLMGTLDHEPREREPQSSGADAFGDVRQLANWLTNAVPLLSPFQQDEALYQSILEKLEAKQYDETLELATQLATQLAERDPASWAQSPLAAAMNEMVSLTAEPRWTRRYWQSHTEWWPLWEELEAVLDEDEEIVALRDLVREARWRPSLVPEVAAVAQRLARGLPEHEAAIRNFAISLLRDSPFATDPELYQANQMALTSHLLEAQRHREALDVVRLFFAAGTETPDPLVQRRMSAFWGLAAAAVGEDLDEAAAALELTSVPEDDPDRGFLVLALAQVYARQGEIEAEAELLAAELERPIVRGSTWAAELEQRLEDALAPPAPVPVEEEPVVEEKPVEEKPVEERPVRSFDDAISFWMERFGPAWLGFAKPPSLARLEDPIAALSPMSSAWRSSEQVKIAFLTANDSSRNNAERITAFVTGLDILRGITPRYSAARSFLQGAVDELGLGLAVRRAAHLLILTDAFQAGDLATFESYLEHPLYESYAGPQRQAAQLFHRTLQVRQGTYGDILAVAEVQTQAGVVEAAYQSMDLLFESLLRRRSLTDARNLMEAFRSWDEGWYQQKENRLEKVEALQPMVEALAEITRQRLGELPPLPDLATDLKQPQIADLLDGPNGRATILHEALGTISVPTAEGLARWPLRLYRASEPTAENTDLALDQVLAAGRAAPSDEVRFLVFLTLPEILSPDDSERYSRFFNATKTWRSPRDSRTAGLLRLLSAARAWRTTGEIDLDTLDKNMTAPELLWLAERMKIRRLVQLSSAAESKRDLRSFLEGIPWIRLWELRDLAENLRAAELAGHDKLEELRSLAEDEALTATLESWVEPDASMILRVLDLSAALGESVYPPAWREHVAASVDNPRLSAEIRLADAEIRGDWQTALEAARELVDMGPFNADHLWNLGRAAAELERIPQALEALSTFATQALDHPRLLEAGNLIRTLETASDTLP